MPTKPTPKKRTPAKRTPAEPTLAHRIHALLNTVRHIAHHEDELCTLLHEAEHTAEITPALSRDLKRLLTRMPAPDTYLADMETLRTALKPPKPTAGKTPARKKRS